MDGLIVINKEKGMTSRDVVNEICKIFKTKKVGHTGTLDPLAEGVLVVALGQALKKVEFLINETKEYLVELKLGLSTDTLDITGNVVESKPFKIDEETIIKTLSSFIGKQIQEVPIYSSVRVDGKRLYEYARNNIEVDLPKREIEIFDIKFISLKDDIVTFKTKVSKGTYIRSLVRDIGKKISIPCCMNSLIRTKQGNFEIENSYTLQDIKNGNYKLIDSDITFDKYEKVMVDEYLENKILNGSLLENRYNKDKIVFINNSNKVLGIYKIYDKDPNKIKPIKIFK